jgi:hypothetical protein
LELQLDTRVFPVLLGEQTGKVEQRARLNDPERQGPAAKTSNLAKHA